MTREINREEAERLTNLDLSGYDNPNRYIFYLTEIEVEVVDMPARSVTYLPLRNSDERE